MLALILEANSKAQKLGFGQAVIPDGNRKEASKALGEIKGLEELGDLVATIAANAHAKENA
ncbi:MAG: hypothetical protein MI808_12550 [Pseudomonadales bacterium]|nr:hypothetical protein [Pseudomonadales bacterium]